MNFKSFKLKFQKGPVKEFPNKVGDYPVLTVCVQTYQHSAYIKECLDGILSQQTNFPFEILLGEDDSTDGTREICLKFAKKHQDKIRLFLHTRENNIEINGIPTGRFNFMYNLFQAKGKYIALLDGDDYWTDTLKLQKQVDFLRSYPESVFTFTSNKYLFPDGRLISRDLKGMKESGSFIKLLDQNFVINSTVVFKNRIPQEGLPPLLTETFIGDWPLFLWLLRKKGVFNFLNFESTVYRRHVGISEKYKALPLLNLQSQVHLKNILLVEPEFEIYGTDIKKSKKKNWLQIMSYCNKRKKYLKGLRCFSKALGSNGLSQQLRIYFYSISLGLQKSYK